MPNIVITEGLDTPWELQNTESNITAATDLTSINLANQTVGTLAYTASQLFGSLKTEKDNLDKIVDAIELINEEIALWPERIAKWDSVSSLNIPDSAVSVVTLPSPYEDIAFANSVLDKKPDPSRATEFIGVGSSGLDEERNYIATLNLLIEAKPLLDTAISLPSDRIGYVVLTREKNFGFATWSLKNSIIEGQTPGIGGNIGDLVVYRDSSGKPVSYELLHGRDLDVPEIASIQREILSPSQVLSFAVPRDTAELARWRDAVKSADLIAATNALNSQTGLPEGVTPPVTTLGVSVDKYFDQARYSTVEVLRLDDGRITVRPGQTPNTIFGNYPPLSPANLDLSKMTAGDVNKFFQEPGTNRIFYIESITNGKISYRLVTAKDPFIAEMTDDVKKALRGEYAEKQILLTQRSTDQTLFVTSITQRYTTFSDMATNLLKTLVNFYNDLARNLRG